MSRLTWYFEQRKLDALRRKVDELDRRRWPKIARWITRDEAKRVLVDARAFAPHGTGVLKKGLTVRAMKGRRGTSSHGVVTPTRERLARRKAKRGRPRKGAKGKGRRTDLRILKGDGYYPAHLELGTRRMRRQAYLKRAILANSRDYVRNVRRKVRIELERALGRTSKRRGVL